MGLKAAATFVFVSVMQEDPIAPLYQFARGVWDSNKLENDCLLPHCSHPNAKRKLEIIVIIIINKKN